MIVDVVLCKDCIDFEQDPKYPHIGNCYNSDVIGSDGVPYVSRNADDYCSYGIKKEKDKWCI